MIQNTFPVPSVSVYNKWTPEKLKKNHTFLNGMFFFSVFFPSNNRTQEILYSIFFCQSWWPTCCFCGCDSFDEWEKSQGYHLLQSPSDGHSCSGWGFPSTYYNKSQNNTNTIQLLKQRLKDRKCSLDFKTFFLSDKQLKGKNNLRGWLLCDGGRECSSDNKNLTLNPLSPNIKKQILHTIQTRFHPPLTAHFFLLHQRALCRVI